MGQFITRQFPRYVLFDTNCFLEAICGVNPHYDYDRIKLDVKKNNAYIVISAFTLYELIQGLVKVENIELFRNQLINFGDFYILNNDRILEHDFLEYGLDYIFIFEFQNNEKLIEFAGKRKELRDKAYRVLFKSMFLYSALAAASLLTLGECDEKGNINSDTYIKCNFILNQFFQLYYARFEEKFAEYYEHAGYPTINLSTGENYIDYNAKDKLREYIRNLVIEIIAVAEAELPILKNEIEQTTTEFNSKIEKNIIELSRIIFDGYFRKINLKAEHLTNGKLNIEKVLDMMMSNCPDSLKKDSFIFMVKNLFNSGGFGKTLNNDFIDFSNMILVEKFSNCDAVFMTYEKKWKEFLETQSRNMYANYSNQFCEEYLIRRN